VEFHVDPADNYCDVYVIRDLDNHSLGGDPVSIDDIEDWSLGEADEVDARLSNELARHTGNEAALGGVGEEGEDDAYGWAANSSFSLWMDRVSRGIFSGVDFSICEGLRKELASLGLIKSDAEVESFEDLGGGDAFGDEEVLSEVPAGARTFLRRTLDATDRMIKHPLTAVDTLADTLVRGVSNLVSPKKRSG
jgi:hypothetical protein